MIITSTVILISLSKITQNMKHDESVTYNSLALAELSQCFYTPSDLYLLSS